MSIAQREALVLEVWETARSIRAAQSVGAAGCQFSVIAKRLGLKPRASGNWKRA